MKGSSRNTAGATKTKPMVLNAVYFRCIICILAFMKKHKSISAFENVFSPVKFNASTIDAIMMYVFTEF